MKNSITYIIIISIAAVAIGAATLVLVSNHTAVVLPAQENNNQNIASQSSIQNLKKFNSTDELQKFLLDSQASTQYYGGTAPGGLENQLKLAQVHPSVAAPLPPTTQGAPAQGGVATTDGGSQYSTTNVQV